MTSPAAAIAWDIWHRHRNRLFVIAFLILAFALLYPKLCVLLGLDPHAPNALDAIAASASERFKDATDLSRISQVLGLLFMLLGPVACMVVSLLYVIWIFTLAQLDSRKGFGFPSRMFTLPVSTNYLAALLLVAGAATLALVYAGWTFLVRLPNIDVFDGYPNFLAWLTLMVVSQAIMWALDGFQVARVVLLSAAMSGFAFLTGPALRDHPTLAQNQTAILLSFLIIGCAVAFVGLAKIRHGAWQRWPWKLRVFLPFRRTEGSSASASVSSSASFRSPARAQFWFEWRAHIGASWLFVCGLSGTALLIMAVVAARVGTLSEGDTEGLTLALLGVPLFIHFVHGLAPRNLAPFLATRPLSSGDFVMARLKTAALSTVLCWAITFAMLSIVPLLGDVSPMLNNLPLHISSQRLWPLLAFLAFGLVFLTWRFVPADLWLVCAPKTWAAKAAVIKLYAGLALAWLLSYLARDVRFEDTLYHVLAVLFACLIVLKLVLAQRAFRACLRKRLVAASAVLNYLLVWLVLTAALLIPTLLLFHPEKWILPIALGIVLLVPLARIGFAPLALSLSRHR